MNQRGFAPIIIVVIALLVLGGGGAGYWYYQKQKAAPPATPTDEGINQEAKPATEEPRQENAEQSTETVEGGSEQQRAEQENRTEPQNINSPEEQIRVNLIVGSYGENAEFIEICDGEHFSFQDPQDKTLKNNRTYDLTDEEKKQFRKMIADANLFSLGDKYYFKSGLCSPAIQEATIQSVSMYSPRVRKQTSLSCEQGTLPEIPQAIYPILAKFKEFYDRSKSSSEIIASYDPKKTRDSVRMTELRKIQLGLEMYADANNGFYPKELSAIVPKYVAVLSVDPLTKEQYFYAVPAGGNSKKYHLGARLENVGEPELSKDSDFDSSGTGYSNGFAGTDPVYDLVTP